MARNLPHDDPTLGAEHAAIIGTIGSGKSFAEKWILGSLYGERQILLMNTKDDPNFKHLDAVYVTHAMALNRYRDPARWPLLIYTPVGSELNFETLDAVCQFAYNRQNTILAIDEVTQVTPPANPGLGLLNAITRGRSRHVSVIACTQRPVKVPPIVLSEASLIYLFELRRRQDRETVDDYTEDNFADRVRRTKEQGEKYTLGIYRAGEGGIIYPDIQTALAE